jgi:hypothetical protein
MAHGACFGGMPEPVANATTLNGTEGRWTSLVLKEGNMVRKSLLGAVMLCASAASSVRAQDFTPPALPDFTEARPISTEGTALVRTASSMNPAPAPVVAAPGSVYVPGAGMVVGAPGGNVVAVPPVAGPGCTYPKLNAPLYPSPQQFNPPWTGGAIITNQALAPHEMLYPHRYHAMYGPFYYRVKGCWVMTPFGMRQHEAWQLQGTEVKVNYRSHYAPFSGFHPKCLF